MKLIAIGLLSIGVPLSADAFGAGPELSQGAFAIDGAQISTCVDDAANAGIEDFVNAAEAACAGLGFDICTENGAPIAFGRLSALSCLTLERAYWEWRIERVVNVLSGSQASPGHEGDLLDTLPELEALDRIWRAYSETKCSYFTSEYGVAPSRGREGDIVESACRSKETARFALELEARLRAHCSTQRGAIYGSACETGQ